MENRWNTQLAKDFEHDHKRLRVYTSRLLGQEPQLVLHGGGNTSVKIDSKDFFGESVETLFVKGSGWDLATIEEAGFAPLRMEVLLRLAQLKSLSDSDMVEQQRLAMLDSKAPNASVEAILHAIIPFRYVDHTHANAVLAITNTANGLERIQEIFGKRVIIIPYVMPGFALAKLVYEQTKDIDWNNYEGMVLMNHGIFTFSNDGKESYDRMIQLVSEAEEYLKKSDATIQATDEGICDPVELANLRRQVSLKRGVPIVAKLNSSPDAVGYSNFKNIEKIGTRGPLTPDHSIFAKRIPVTISDSIDGSIECYASEYQSYFDRNTSGELNCLDSAPRWAIWPGRGLVSFGLNPKNATVIGDIASHTSRVIQISESLGEWTPLNESDVFEVEYWELEQAKLKSGKSTPPLQGNIVLIALTDTSLANECEKRFASDGAAATILKGGKLETVDGLSIEQIIQTYGGIDILVTDIRETSSIGVSHDLLLSTLPFLELGIHPKIVIAGSVSSPTLKEAYQKLTTHLPESSDNPIQVIAVNPSSGEALVSANKSASNLDHSYLIEKITTL